MQERTGSQAAVGQSACSKITTYTDQTLGAKGGSIRSDLSSICSRGRRACCRDRLFGILAHFHLVACSGGDVAAVVPNGVIDFAFEAATKDGLKLAL